MEIQIEEDNTREARHPYCLMGDKIAGRWAAFMFGCVCDDVGKFGKVFNFLDIYLLSTIASDTLATVML